MCTVEEAEREGVSGMAKERSVAMWKNIVGAEAGGGGGDVEVVGRRRSGNSRRRRCGGGEASQRR